MGPRSRPPGRPTNQTPLPRRGVGRVKLLKCSRGETGGGTEEPPLHTHTQPPPSTGEPLRTEESPAELHPCRVAVAALARGDEGGARGEPGGRERSRRGVLLHHPWEKLPSGAKTYGRRRPMGPRRKITAAHSAANPRGPCTMALVCVSPLPRGYVFFPPTPPGWAGWEKMGRESVLPSGRGLSASVLPLIRIEMK